MNKEQVYDERVAPLMAQILEICKEAGIAMLATFAIPTPENEDLHCTSLLPDGEGVNPPAHRKAYSLIRGGTGGTLHLRTVDGEGNQTLTAIVG